MIELKARVHKAYVRRFKQKSGGPKYGTLNKGFTELELAHFLRNVPNDKFGLLFRYQAYLGLRIGEVTRLHVGNIDFEKRELTIDSEKRRKMDSVLIPLELFKETVSFVMSHENEIKEADGHIFFKDRSSHAKGAYLDADYVRKVFRETIQKANLESVYGYSDETMRKERPRALHRLTTHSLRHYAITKFAKSTNGNLVLASRFARHTNPSVTMRYISRDKEQLYKEIDAAFSDQIGRLRVFSTNFKTERK
jgi:integrase